MTATPLAVIHDHGTGIGIAVGDVEIASYVYGADIPAFEAPKPYLHPMRTLSGALVSAYRPHDHRWHKGLQMTWSHVSGQNFWGGNTYTHGQGYIPKDNVGSMRHDSFEVIELTGAELAISESLTWVASTGEEWVSERRTLRFHGVDTGRGTWMLDFATELTNIRGEALELGSPTTHGRENAGYTGFFWRGPRGFTSGEIITADGGGGPETMGTTASPWLAYTGKNDEVDGGATMLVFAGTTSRGELTWFVRNDPFPAINPSPAFDEEITLADGDSLALSHRVVVADRIWDRDEIEGFAAEHTP
ncbi:PmoA family protein [Pseudonocardia sp. MH-G8]|uniref:DUF6807 domain-containing protein n=1 Tax=Pseudonocardia sp. MH-G8 TaxID=1854588 RepID=UPI000BA17F91|nr:PmoA family protein [Pseudonocardia sp. MH-G8]OZM82953.1 hypothetical protein CFP66_07780 [Pseudonocardia sp. MH-G8]